MTSRGFVFSCKVVFLVLASLLLPMVAWHKSSPDIKNVIYSGLVMTVIFFSVMGAAKGLTHNIRERFIGYLLLFVVSGLGAVCFYFASSLLLMNIIFYMTMLFVVLSGFFLDKYYPLE